MKPIKIPKIAVNDPELAKKILQIVSGVELRVGIARVRHAFGIPPDGLARTARAPAETDEEHKWMDDFELTDGSEKFNFHSYRNWRKSLTTEEYARYLLCKKRLLRLAGGLSSEWHEFMEELVLFNNPNKQPEHQIVGGKLRRHPRKHSGAYTVGWTVGLDQENQIIVTVRQKITKTEWAKIYDLEIAPFNALLPNPLPRVSDPKMVAQVMELHRAHKDSIQISAATGLDDANVRKIISRNKHKRKT